MKCPHCESTQIRKNGHQKGKQRYLCKNCRKQFVDHTSIQILANLELEDHQEIPSTPTPEIQVITKLPVATSEIQNWLSAQGICLLLLDVENLKLDVKTEQFLATLCVYPLQVKIAFANWRNSAIGQQDVDFHKRGYQLIHVPGGKDSADAKMIVRGMAICCEYPQIKEVFICSSDTLLMHLCNELQIQGLTVYHVRRHGTVLIVENRNTGETQHYSILIGSEIPELDDLAEQLKNLVTLEQNSLNDRLCNLNNLSILFQERLNLAVNANRPNISSINEEKPDGNLSTSELELTNPSPVSETTMLIPGVEAKPINSVEDLERVIMQMIKAMTSNTDVDYVAVDKIKNLFQSLYNEPADTIIKKFKPNSSLIKFLRSQTSLFKLTLLNTEHQVAIK